MDSGGYGEGIDDIFGEDHIVTVNIVNILRLGVFNSFGLYHPLSAFPQTHAYCLNVYSTVKQLNKILTAYD